MSKEASMTIRIESQLRQSFNEATELERRPAAQVMRELMYDYVERVRSKAAGVRRIDAHESAARRADIEAGIASVSLEGFAVPDAYRAEADRFIRGELTFEKLGEEVEQLIQDRLARGR
ncbi:antitoxin VbhA family protein [Brucella sp. 22210]|uniref:antitoxin VbhA family protein n=1 Tax=Brucella sp. 22210 TaxID=3453892 RepID=UPI003F826175